MTEQFQEYNVTARCDNVMFFLGDHRASAPCKAVEHALEFAPALAPTGLYEVVVTCENKLKFIFQVEIS